MPENTSLSGQVPWEANDDFVAPDVAGGGAINDPMIFTRHAQLRELAAAAASGRRTMLAQIEVAQQAAIITALDELATQLARLAAAMRMGVPAQPQT